MESSGAASCSSPSSPCPISSRPDCVGCSTATGSAPSRGSSRGWDSSPSPSSRGAIPCGRFPDLSSSQSGPRSSACCSSSTSRLGSIGSAREGPLYQGPGHRLRDRNVAEGERYIPGPRGLLRDRRTGKAPHRPEGCTGCRIRRTKSRPLSHRQVRSWSRCSRSRIARTRARSTGRQAGARAGPDDSSDGTSSGAAPEIGSTSSTVPMSVPIAPGANLQRATGATGVASSILHSPIGNGVWRDKGRVLELDSIMRISARNRPDGKMDKRLARRSKLVSVVDDARVPLLAELAERGLDLHPNPDVLRLHVNQLRRESHALVHLDDRHDVRLLHLELGGGIVDDGVRDHAPLSAQLEPLHLADRLAAADRADRPRREIDLAAAPALRADQVVAALDLAPKAGDGQGQSPRSNRWTTAVAPVPPRVCVRPWRAPTTCRLPASPRS